jgi:hypothetical protein
VEGWAYGEGVSCALERTLKDILLGRFASEVGTLIHYVFLTCLQDSPFFLFKRLSSLRGLDSSPSQRITIISTASISTPA